MRVGRRGRSSDEEADRRQRAEQEDGRAAGPDFQLQYGLTHLRPHERQIALQISDVTPDVPDVGSGRNGLFQRLVERVGMGLRLARLDAGGLQRAHIFELVENQLAHGRSDPSIRCL